MKILLVGAGRRVAFASLVRNSATAVDAYETDRHVPISEVVSHVFLTQETQLSDIVDDYDLVIPLHERVLPKAAYLGMDHDNILVSSPQAIDICGDKHKFADWMENHFPDIYPSPQVNKPLIIKPRLGCGSAGIRHIPPMVIPYRVDDSNDIVVQEEIPGNEFTVDAYFRHGVCIGTLPRQRLRVAGGEVVDSVTVNNKELHSITKAIGERMQIDGPCCAQFRVRGDGAIFCFEVNARFGGGNTLSHAAGFNMIECATDHICRRLPIRTLRGHYAPQYGVYMRRTFRDHFFQA